LGAEAEKEEEKTAAAVAGLSFQLIFLRVFIDHFL
jgi:hypothetical protein